MKVVLGKADSHEVEIDLDLLLRTRLLVQASSGGGKSWLLRRLAEELFGKVQVIIVDPEGEFASLRERFDYVLVGKGGETPADVRSAALVAHKLLELHVSAVCDIFEMKPADRHRWVRLFLDAMIDAPKTLWHPVVVIIDEAHVYAPEKSAGESEASEAVISLATRGRKRGFCAVLATQRLGKLRKDAAAELGNVLIGPTNIDIDVARAAEALGIAKPDILAFKTQMRTLGTGRFWAFGRAITDVKTLVTVGSVLTTHPEIGGSKKAAEPPPAPEKIKALLPKLADLPKAAEEKAKTEAELRAEIRALKVEVRERPKVEVAKTVEKRVEVPVLSKAARAAIERAAVRFEDVTGTLQSVVSGHMPGLLMAAADLRAALNPIHAGPVMGPVHANAGAILPKSQSAKDTFPARQRRAGPGAAGGNPASSSENGRLGKAERSVLSALAQYPTGRTKRQVAILTGYAVSGGGFGNALSRLRSLGYVEGSDLLRITETGLSSGVEWEALPTGDALLEHWKRQLPKAERAVLDILAAAYPRAVAKEDLAESAGYAADGGGFGNALSRLRTLELISGRGELRASEELFS